ncbi:MAG: GHMP kinase [Candidatus Eisenbacteria bacterium]|uniref:GHMP kinase n=1 Tax=Eiseniibacteriota bacterium TaxID=2212470 RepID=A0A956RQ71_UNCEI|nr:GHMP kinase [Candidatus Eisenbacteria bacterium]
MIDPIFRAKAPLRISFCGGGTDVSPYPEEKGGVVLSATIDKYAYASLRPTETGMLRVTSLDFDLTREYPLGRPIELGDELDLIKGVVNHFQFREGADPFPSGCDIFLHSDAPPGSGLGSSSTMVTTLVGVIAEWLRHPLTPYEIAERTYRIERQELRLAGGRQDQYAATFGGFNFMEFLADHTVVNPLRLRRDTLCELEYSLLLCYTGRTRLSAHIVENQTRSYREGKDAVVSALDEMKRIAIHMKGLLLRDRISEFGEMLHQAWQHKRNLDAAISTPQIDELYQAARAEGAIGGKILGAGGGGYLLVQAPFEAKHKVARALEALGGEVVPFAFEGRGLQTWIARG